MVVTGVADRMPERVAALVHIDAQVPRDGESLWSLTTPEFRESYIEGCDDGFSVVPPPNLDERVTPHPLASFVPPVRLTGRGDAVPVKRSVWLSGW